MPLMANLDITLLSFLVCILFGTPFLHLLSFLMIFFLVSKSVADFHLETYKREFGVLLTGLLISDALFDSLVMSV